MKKLTVLVDLDDTLENLGEVWVSFLNAKYGTNVHRDEITEWDMSVAFSTISKDQIYEPLHNEDLWKRVSPLPQAAESLQKLINDGHKVIIVTASEADTISMKFDHVLSRHFPFICANDVIIASQKQLIRGDVLVDDGIHNLDGGQYEKILMDAPHNRKYDAEKNGMTRVKTWEEAYRKICEISNRL